MGNNPIKYTDPDGRFPVIIPMIIVIEIMFQSCKQESTGGLPYKPDEWNSNAYIRESTNCYAYALDLKKNPLSGMYFSRKEDSSFGLQPGGLSGGKLCAIDATMIEPLVEADCKKIGYMFKKTTIDSPVKKGNWKIALATRVNHPLKFDDYHFYRQDKEGSWSHKQGMAPVTNMDDEKKEILDPRYIQSTYTFIDFYEVGPNE